MISSADFQKITTLIFDIDGTLTDGRAAWLPDGWVLKFFDHHDMHWIKLAVRAGLKVGLLSGGDDPASRKFAKELSLSFAVFGAKDKLAAWEGILRDEKLSPDECLYAGDDVVDIPVIKRAGIGVVVHNGVDLSDECEYWRTDSDGGHGAVQEIICRVLKEKNLYDLVMERYRR